MDRALATGARATLDGVRIGIRLTNPEEASTGVHFPLRLDPPLQIERLNTKAHKGDNNENLNRNNCHAY